MAILSDLQLPPDQVAFLKEHGHLFRTDLARKRKFSPIEKLACRAFEHGGAVFLVQQHEPDLGRLLDRGEVFDGANPLRIDGKPSQCHQNAAWHWSDNDDTVEIVTGYALSSDGVWRQHSWCRQIADGRIVETTEERVLYFGVRLSHEEAENFFDSQI